MSSLAEYIAGLILCVIVSFVYSLARKDEPRAVLKETLLVLTYTLGAISAVVLVVLLLSKFI
ncbi:MAG: hypothetical protein R6V58_05660 [Planctomycetota bacterium]